MSSIEDFGSEGLTLNDYILFFWTLILNVYPLGF